MENNRLLPLIGFILLVVLIQWAGYEMTLTSVRNWYLTLKKPSWTPPSWIFGPAWTILYLSIAISGWLVFIKSANSKNKKNSFYVYGAQLIANLLWSYFFFSLKSPLISLVDITILIALIGLNIHLFLKLYKPAGFLLIPYLLWILYAFSLNLAIWKLN